ncbi:DNA-processing protein DprA [Clostridium intestinale]|uniref:DNA-processing protein DprA n=1 Tax=Clostridium intestinale TaxID=36845 RepID=UPI002DD69A9D|nr:DNA-processing protein DprA [Clostridium intestinale]WRY53907.1 DNA-processing protein DprA [Clostridium intestinale]
MGNLYYITLYLLGVNNKLLIDIINIVPKKELSKLFTEECLNFQFKYSLDLSKVYSALNDKSNVYKQRIKAQEIITKSRELGIKIIPINSRNYPKILKEIDNPPAILYLKGKNIVKDDEKSVGCVGTRVPTEFGTRAVASIVSNLTKEGFTIISGLAYGIDKESHEACLNNNGKTIAVLAHGLDTLYPKEHSDLEERILKNDGTIISEYPVGTKADKFRFVDRNRIVSGLSKGLIVFEAKEKSGTMHTVNFALSQKKKVFCPVPVKKEEQTLGLYKLLNEKKAIGIKTKDNYDVIVNELGYKVKNDKDLIMRNKHEKMSSLINTEDGLLKEIYTLTLDKRASFGVEKEVYENFKSILSENDLSLKEFFNAVILNIVKNYKKGKRDE